MNDQGEANDEDDGGRGVNGAPLAIESLDDYIRRYGLPHANGVDQAGGEFNGLNRLEALERVRAEEAYRDEVILRHQAETTPEAEGKKEDDSPRLDEEDEAAIVSVILADESIREMPVQPLIAFCDTAKRMVTSRWRYGQRHGVAEDDEAKAEEKEESASIMELSLVEFDTKAVLQFMDALISLHDHQQKEDSSESTADQTGPSSRKRRMSDDTNDTTKRNEHIMTLIDEGKISEQHIVECLKLAHFLQCTVVLETLVPLVQLSIDSHNCMAICSLADALNLKSLFEASVNYVIERLDAFQGTAATIGRGEEEEERKRPSSSDEDGEAQETMEEIWASLPYELRSRVLTMRNVMRSSVIGRGSKVSGLFFSSGSEFLAIFRETIRDQKERLTEARERREEVIRERTEEWVVRSQRRGRWFDASAEAKKNFVYGADVDYALEKIEKQCRRLETLESFYNEQKTIFKGGGFESGIRL